VRTVGEVVLVYPSERDADIVLGAVARENIGFVEGRREGTRLIFRVGATTPLGLLRTLDDLLACVAVAEGVLVR
jgi:hypothetical protein